MKRILLYTIILFAVACGSAAPTADDNVDQTQQESTTYYSVSNGYRSLPTSSTKFCRLTSAASKGGHNLSDTWSTWIEDYPFWPYKRGTLVSAASSLWAKVYGGASLPSRTASANATCNDFSDFGFGPQASRSSANDGLWLSWPATWGDETVSEDASLWYISAWCYLNGWESVSSFSESVSVYRFPAGGLNYIQAYGWPGLTAHATCVFPDRYWEHMGPYTRNEEGVTVGPPADGKTICAFMSVQGNMDDTLTYIYEEGGYWKLLVQNLDPNDSEYWKRKVQMTCARFP